MNVDLQSHIGKLNDTCRKALDAAAGLCFTRTHYDVDLEHFLFTLSAVPDSDMQCVLRYYDVDMTDLTRDLTRALDRLQTGNAARTPAMSRRILRWIREAWTLASIDFNAVQIRSGHLLLALVTEAHLARLARESSAVFAQIAAEELHQRLLELTTGSAEDRASPLPVTPVDPQSGGEHVAPTPALDQYTIDLTARARQGDIDPVLERDFEIRQLVDILMRRRQNNPILTGEAGVGKTAVAEGLALRIVAGDVPPPLRHVSLRTLDLALLQAGAGVRGEFENRLKSVIHEVKASPQPVILFIDEAHTLIGAGGQTGQGDAANILKPALARGELRTIAATTWSEYKKYFEQDAALARRFQVVKVEEPTEAQAVAMMRGLVVTLEQHHQVRVLEEAVEAAVRLSHRYITGRQLPDKAVSVLDTACARVALGQAATPPAIEDCQRRLTQIGTEADILERESLTGSNYHERLEALAQEKVVLASQLAELQAHWADEQRLITEIRARYAQLEQHVARRHSASDGQENGRLTAEEVARLQGELSGLNAELAQVQGATPLMQACVDGQTIAEVVSGWTGIPVGKMVKDEINTVLSLQELLEQRIVGQSHALAAIGQRIHTARARLEDPRRPIGVFLLVGPSGVGKTETALALADTLYGGERNMVTINMSEYQEAHTVSGLKGAPPGYVGYREGGVLTEAVLRRPYCVLLLDEIEKAHPDVMELFYQVFDRGLLEDAEGREIDFKNTVILMTSNVGTATIMQYCADPETRPEPVALARTLRPDLLKVFKPAFLGRMVVVPYYPLSDDVMRQIIALQLGRIQTRLYDNHRARFSYDDTVVTEIARRCTEVESGARNVDYILTHTLLPEIARACLGRMAAGESIARVHVSVGTGGSFVYEVA
jgi:type VI secretion system protein VasG